MLSIEIYVSLDLIYCLPQMIAMKRGVFGELECRLAAARQRMQAASGIETRATTCNKGKTAFINNTHLGESESACDLIEAVKRPIEMSAGGDTHGAFAPRAKPSQKESVKTDGGNQSRLWESISLEVAPLEMREGLKRMEEALREELLWS